MASSVPIAFTKPGADVNEGGKFDEYVNTGKTKTGQFVHVLLL
jgi:hypothetical protein